MEHTGLLLSFEGIDGCGKSTQITLLREALEEQGIHVHVFREPGGTTVSETIRSILLDPKNELNPVTEVLLFSSARSQLVTESILPALKRGEVVILDRFFDSTTAYQGFGHQILTPEELQSIHKLAAHGLEPALTFYLKIPLSLALERTAQLEKDRMESMGDAFFERVINGYDQLALQEQRFVTIEADQEIMEIHRQILQVVHPCLG
jgi:dTMP kinase